MRSREAVGDSACVGFACCEHTRASHLHAVERAALADDEIEGSGVAVGFGDGESLSGGAGHELQFDPLSDELGMVFSFHWVWGMRLSIAD